MKKIFINVFLGLGLFFLCYSSAFANVDISLEDDTANKEMSIIVNSNDEYIDGIDLSIIFSDNITINDEDLPESVDACTMSGAISSSDNKLYLECFNDSGTKMSGVVATIPYSTEEPDYYFYVDTSTLDLGNEEKGTITNINYSDIDIEELQGEENADDTDEETEETFFDKVINFIDSYFYYIAGGAVVLVIAIILGMKLSKPKIDDVSEDLSKTSPEQNQQSSTANVSSTADENTTDNSVWENRTN